MLCLLITAGIPCLPHLPAEPPVIARDDVAVWPQFRGPRGLSCADDTPFPLDFGPEKHLLWKAALPAGHSSPCVHGEQLFVTGYQDGRDVVLALDRASGALVWQRSFRGEPTPAYYHVDAVPALPSPCTDGERLYVYIASYGLVALGLDGQTIWERRFPHPGYGFGVGTSPIVAAGRVILARDGAPEAALFAFDAKDGSDAWQVGRMGFIEGHGTPFVWSHADRTELVLGGTSQVCSFDPASGAPLWNVQGVTLFGCTTPTADADTLYYAGWSTPNSTGRAFWDAALGRSFELSDAEVADPNLIFTRLDRDGDDRVSRDEAPASRAKDAFGFLDRNGNGAWERDEFVNGDPGGKAPGRNVVVAISKGGSGDVTASHVKWTGSRGIPYVASPLLYRGQLWLVKEGGLVSVLAASNGEPAVDRARLPSKSEYYMSPVGAAGYVLIGAAEGELYVVEAGAKEALRVVHSTDLGERLFATPAVLEGKLYVRTERTLWAFGAQP